jgi:hypothetical protein
MADTVHQLKADINTGKTGDKITEGFDPGLATLGTDDEAAGSPNTPEQVAMARSMEKAHAAPVPLEQGATPGTRRMPVAWLVGVVFVLMLAAIGAALWMGRL